MIIRYCGLLISNCALLFLLFHVGLLHTAMGANLHSNPVDPINNQGKHKGEN